MAGRPESGEGGVADAETGALAAVREVEDGGRIVIGNGGREMANVAVDGVEEWLLAVMIPCLESSTSGPCKRVELF